MAIVKVIEVIAESKESWEAATQNAIDHASKSINNIQSIYIKEFKASVKNNLVDKYLVNAKVSFTVDE